MFQRIPSPLAVLALLAVPGVGQTPCGTFTSTPVPVDPAWWEAELEDVTTLPDGTAWASGHFATYGPFQPIENFTLAMHWDGQQWTHVPTPSPSPYPGGTKAYLHTIAALAPDDVWAAGERHGDAGGLSVGAWIMVQHWDGSTWDLVPVPAPPGGTGINFSGTRVEDMVALAEDDVWFGGQWGEPNALASVTWRPLAMHWDGSKLEVFDTPAPYEDFYGFKIVSMSAVSSDDIWAACNRLTAGGHAQQLVVLHWDGSSWQQVSVPSSGEMRVLYTVEAVAADDVWIFGEDQWPAGPEDVFALHYDGSGWTELTGAPPARGAFALGSAAIYTGAGYNIGHGAYFFEGQQSTQIEDFPGLNVHVFEGERGVGCSGWLVGREMVGGKKPFAARLEASAAAVSYCTAGTSASGCRAALSSSGTPSASESSGFDLLASSVEGAKDGLFFFGTVGRQASPWGNGTSFQCVAPPVARADLLAGTGTSGQCDGAFSQDLNALWCPTCPKPQKNPGAGAVVQAQLWYRDPQNTSNQTTSLSDAVEFLVGL